MKKLIINADDFGLSKEVNEAVKQGFLSGAVTSASVITNGDAFDNALNEVFPVISDLDLGFHFNIMEGKSFSSSPLLCDCDGFFNNNYLKLITNSYDKKFLKAVEDEFRLQIEKILAKCEISHLDSHVHTHSIPNIFKLFIKLAKEYNIKYIRTSNEIPYIVYSKILNRRFPVNIIKNGLLNTFSAVNKKSLYNTQIKTNDYFIGVLYTGYMDENTILQGLKKINKEDSLTEIIIHPSLKNEANENYGEYKTAQNPTFKENLNKSGFVLSNFKFS